MPCRNCSSCTATRWRYQVDHAWLGCVVTGLIISADEAAILEKRRCRLLQEDPPTPEAPGAASPIHGRIAVNCRMGMCYMSWVLLVKKKKSHISSWNVQKCHWCPEMWRMTSFLLIIRVLLPVDYTFSQSGCTCQHLRAYKHVGKPSC